MGGRSVIRRRAAWACVLALLAQAVAMSWPHRMPQTTGLQMVLCTPYGYQVVRVDDAEPDKARPGEPAKPVDDKKTVGRGCALCAALAHVAIAPPPAIILPRPPRAVAAAPWITVAGRVLPARDRLLPQARAPPAALLV